MEVVVKISLVFKIMYDNVLMQKRSLPRTCNTALDASRGIKGLINNRLLMRGQ